MPFPITTLIGTNLVKTLADLNNNAPALLYNKYLLFSGLFNLA
jgi:hypothetical protein